MTPVNHHLALAVIQSLLRRGLPLGIAVEIHTRGNKAVVIERPELMIAPYRPVKPC